MVDTGAAFTMITKAFADYHSLPVASHKRTFRQADSLLGTILGLVSFIMQVHNHLEMELVDVAI